MSRTTSRLASPTTADTSCSGTRHSNSTSMPKLRDSCVACASSKVRCHRQKPSCSRCLKRKITCEYVTSKRGGRNPAGRSETPTTSKANTKAASVAARRSSQPSTPPLEWFGPSFHSPHADAAQAPRHAATMPISSSTPFMDPFLAVEPSMSLEMESLESDFGRFLASTSEYYSPLEHEKDFNPMNTCMLGDLDAFSKVTDGDYMMPLTDPALHSERSATPAVLSSISSSSVSPVSGQMLPPAFMDNILQETQDYDTTDCQCGCLFYAVGLMKQLFADQSGSDFGLSAGRTSSQVQTTIARNKHALDVVDSILHCYFPHDNYLLLILSMILMKVLDSYADAAYNRRSSVTGSTSGSGNVTPIDGCNSIGNSLGSLESMHSRNMSIASQSSTGCSEKGRSSYGPVFESGNSVRTSMHLILGELHRPQRLVNQLSDLLKKAASRNGGRSADFPNCSSPGRSFSMGGGGSTCIISDVILRQLGQDLKRRLQKLSLDIIEALKIE